MTTTIKRKTDAYQAANRETARIVLADVDRFGGEESLMVRWARLVLSPPAEMILEASEEAGQVCVGLDRPAGYGRIPD